MINVSFEGFHSIALIFGIISCFISLLLIIVLKKNKESFLPPWNDLYLLGIYIVSLCVFIFIGDSQTYRLSQTFSSLTKANKASLSLTHTYSLAENKNRLPNICSLRRHLKLCYIILFPECRCTAKGSSVTHTHTHQPLLIFLHIFTSRLLSFVQTYSRFSSQNAVILAVRTRQTRSRTQPDRRACTRSSGRYEYVNALQERWPLMKEGKRTCRERDQRTSCQHFISVPDPTELYGAQGRQA